MDHLRSVVSHACGLELHVKSLHFAHAAAAVDRNGLASRFGGLGSNQQGSDSERLSFVRIIFNILQSKPKARADRGVGIIRIDRGQEID